MYSNLEKPEWLDVIAQGLRANEHATADMLFSIAARTCRRFPRQTADLAQFDRLLGAGAFTEAMFVLIEFELPQWKLRRIAYDEGEWHCALSRQRELPDWLDQSMEANHADLALAIALAYIEALKAVEASGRSIGHSVPQIRAQCSETLSCENYT